MASKPPTYIDTPDGGFLLSTDVHRVTIRGTTQDTQVHLTGASIALYFPFADPLKAVEFINLIRAAKGLEPYVPPTIRITT